MAEITTAGYEDLRAYVAANWTHIAFRSAGGELFRLPLTDPRVQIESAAGANPVTIRADLAGDDTELGALPVTIQATQLFKGAVGGSGMTAVESFAPFTFGAESDTCTFRHHVEIPEIP